MKENITFTKIGPYEYEIAKVGSMRVPGRIFADETLINEIVSNGSLEQVINVAKLPGIIHASYAMPDIHCGYGFPIGGVAAFDTEEGIISPGGVGYDINCGVRLLVTNLDKEEITSKLRHLTENVFMRVPSGVGSHRTDLKLSHNELRKVLKNGALWAIKNGYGDEIDAVYIENGGRLEDSNPELISERALDRGASQLGTLGSGNHFVEIQYVDTIYDLPKAECLGLFQNGIVVTIHTGSRGLGYQVCDDYLRSMQNASRKYNFELPDRQLVSVPFASPEGKEYFYAMNAAANFAFCNRQIITHYVREAFVESLGISPRDLNMQVMYDICHNIAKVEEYTVEGKLRKLVVHRKGATRALGPQHELIPEKYRGAGQPIIIPGDMGRYSFVVTGTNDAARLSFSSSCHGAGRKLSRTKARQKARGRSIYRELEELGIILQASSRDTVSEEIPEAYKDVEAVVSVAENAGLVKKVARLRPLGVVKG